MLSLQGCPTCYMQPRVAVNASQYKIVNLLKTFFLCSSLFVSVGVFNVWPKTTLLLPVRPRDAKRLATPAYSALVCPRTDTNGAILLFLVHQYLVSY